MSIKLRTPEDFHNKLGMVFHASLALPLLPFVLIYLEIKNNGFTGYLVPSFSLLIMSYAVTLISGLLVLQGMRIKSRVAETAKTQSLLKDKLEHYYYGARNFYLLVGLACSLLALSLWLTTSGVLVVSYVIILFVMSLNRPTLKRYIKDLKLEGEEKDIILNKKEFQF